MPETGSDSLIMTPSTVCPLLFLTIPLKVPATAACHAKANIVATLNLTASIFALARFVLFSGSYLVFL